VSELFTHECRQPAGATKLPLCHTETSTFDTTQLDFISWMWPATVFIYCSTVTHQFTCKKLLFSKQILQKCCLRAPARLYPSLSWWPKYHLVHTELYQFHTGVQVYTHKLNCCQMPCRRRYKVLWLQILDYLTDLVCVNYKSTARNMSWCGTHSCLE